VTDSSLRMEPEQYINLINYLNTLSLTENFNNQQQNQLINYSRQFIVKNNFLYKKDKRKEDNLLRVIRKHEIDAILYMMHNDPTAGHFATDTMFEKIRSRYYWPQMYESIRTYSMYNHVINVSEEEEISERTSSSNTSTRTILPNRN